MVHGFSSCGEGLSSGTRAAPAPRPSCLIWVTQVSSVCLLWSFEPESHLQVVMNVS